MCTLNVVYFYGLFRIGMISGIKIVGTLKDGYIRKVPLPRLSTVDRVIDSQQRPILVHKYSIGPATRLCRP